MAGDLGRSVDSAMSAAQRSLDRAVREVLDGAGKVARQELEKAGGMSATGPDRRFSRWDRAGRLRVKLKKIAGGLLVIPVGPWGVAERGRAPGRMKAWGRGNAMHPGTNQGRKSWSKGRDATFARLGREIPDEIGDKVERGFREG